MKREFVFLLKNIDMQEPQSINYRTLYQMELENRRAVQRELEEIKKQFASYKEKVEKIQEIMD